MTIEELNKLIKEELDAFFEAEEGDDDIEVTTDEPAAETGEEAMDLLRQIYDMIKPEIEGEEGGEEPEMDMEEPEDEGGEDMGDEEEGDEEEELDENMVEVYGASSDPLNLMYFLLGSLGLGAVSFLTLGKEEKKEMANSLKNKVSDIKALAKMSKSALKDIAQDIGLVKGGAEGDAMEEAVDNHTFFRGDNVGRTVVKAKDVQGTREKASLKEGFDGAARFQKLANIKK